MIVPFPYHPWDWYICLLIYHTKQRSASKYYSPMDGLGLIFLTKMLAVWKWCSFFKESMRSALRNRVMRSFPSHWSMHKKNRTGSYSIKYNQKNIQSKFCWKRISLCLYFVLLSNSQKKQRSTGILSAGNLSSSHSKSKRSSHGNTRSHHLYTPGVTPLHPPSRVTWRSLENPPFENGGNSIDSFYGGIFQWSSC